MKINLKIGTLSAFLILMPSAFSQENCSVVKKVTHVSTPNSRELEIIFENGTRLLNSVATAGLLRVDYSGWLPMLTASYVNKLPVCYEATKTGEVYSITLPSAP